MTLNIIKAIQDYRHRRRVDALAFAPFICGWCGSINVPDSPHRAYRRVSETNPEHVERMEVQCACCGACCVKVVPA